MDINGKKEENKLKLVTQITIGNGDLYSLYSDGNLYTEKDGKLEKVEKLSKESKAAIDRIMAMYKPSRTDVVDKEEVVNDEEVQEI